MSIQWHHPFGNRLTHKKEEIRRKSLSSNSISPSFFPFLISDRCPASAPKMKEDYYEQFCCSSRRTSLLLHVLSYMWHSDRFIICFQNCTCQKLKERGRFVLIFTFCTHENEMKKKEVVTPHPGRVISCYSMNDDGTDLIFWLKKKIRCGND